MSFNDELGIRPTEDRLGVELEAAERHLVAPDTVHFAVLTTLGEVSAAGAVGRPVVPVDVSVKLMRRARLGRLVARGTVLKSGRTLAFAEGAVTQDGDTVAKIAVTFAVLS